MKNLLAKILGVSKQLLDWLLILVKTQAADSLSRLLPLAVGIVAELALNNGLGNAEKRAKAVTYLTLAAKAEGVTASLSLINLAVEMGVAQLKASSK